jgi:hypothetical protein
MLKIWEKTFEVHLNILCSSIKFYGEKHLSDLCVKRQKKCLANILLKHQKLSFLAKFSQ